MEDSINIRLQHRLFHFPNPISTLPLVCWFVKSPVSVSKDKTRSASSSESGSDDVGSCSVYISKQKNGKNGLNYRGNYDWNINGIARGLTWEWLDYRRTFLAFISFLSEWNLSGIFFLIVKRFFFTLTWDTTFEVNPENVMRIVMKRFPPSGEKSKRKKAD